MKARKITALPQHLSDLNPQQRRAVTHGLKNGSAPNIRPLLIIAGAGTGKTKTLAHRTAHLITNGVDPDRILLLTFSRRAAEEMCWRVKRITGDIVGNKQVKLPWCGTFHAMAVSLIRRYRSSTGLKPFYTILDSPDAADLMNLARQKLELSAKEAPFPLKDMCLSIYSFWVNSRMPLKLVLEAQFPSSVHWIRELQQSFREYQAAKRRQNVLDYDDLLLYWLQLMDDAASATKIRAQFDHVLVDEYQDTNALQAEILFRLRPGGGGLTVVGDDDQAIYSFRAASTKNMLDFPSMCSPPAKVVVLRENYRSTQSILDAVNSIISRATDRYSKSLFSNRRPRSEPYLITVADERAQAQYVAQRIIDEREAGVPFNKQAVLFRISSHSAELETELLRRNIPFVKYGGPKFLDTTHVKDTVAVVRWCENPKDRSAGFRVLQLIPGIGPRTATKVLDEIEARRRLRAATRRIDLPPEAALHWAQLAKLVDEARRSKTLWPAEFASVLSWYESLLELHYEDEFQSRLQDLKRLELMAAEYRSRRRFLVDVALDFTAGAKASNDKYSHKDRVTLSTIHSAKSREWHTVRILNVIEGCLPLDQAKDLEEERRLLHVAMTRARNALELIVPQRRQYWQGKGLTRPSRLIPASAHGLFRKRRWRGASAKKRDLNYR